MSTDQRPLPPRTPAPPELTSPAAVEQPEKKSGHSLDLSVPKIIGGALAAMTTAAVGSRLGVAGTLIGAALASIVAAIATALYTASLARTGERLKSVIPVRNPRLGAAAETAISDTVALQEEDVPSQVVPAEPLSRRLNWTGIIVAALAVFALAAAAVTGIELASGRTLSGGEGTTIGQVSVPEVEATESTEPSPEPTVTETVTTAPEPSESSEPAEPQVQPSATTEPDADPEPEPEPSASASAAPSAEPSETSEPPTSASAEPSAVPSASGSG